MNPGTRHVLEQRRKALEYFISSAAKSLDFHKRDAIRRERELADMRQEKEDIETALAEPDVGLCT